MAHDHCHCRDYTRSQLLHAAAAAGRQGAAGDRDRACRPRPAPGSRGAASSRAAPAWRSPSTARPSSRSSAFEDGHRPGGHADEGPRLGLLRRRHRRAQRAGAGRRPAYQQPAADPRPRTCDSPAPTLQRGPAAAAGIPRRRPRDPARRGQGHASSRRSATTSPNQSHFTSRHYYEIGELEVGCQHRLARPLHRPGRRRRQPAPGALDGRLLSPMLATASKPVAAIDSVDGYDLWSYAGSDPVETKCSTASPTSARCRSDSPALTQARRATPDRASCARSSAGSATSPARSPTRSTTGSATSSPGSRRLGAGLPVKVVTMSAVGGYDTHANEASTLRRT